jgi:hypothetical protein
MSKGEMYDAGTVLVKGVEHKVAVGDDGKWYAFPGGDKVSAMTREGLVKEIDRHTRKAIAKVEVPFVQLRTNRAPRRGSATGLHSRSGNVLVRWDSGETEQLRTYSNYGTLTHDLTDEQIAEYDTMRRDFADLSQRMNTFRKAHEISLPLTVRQALDAAVSGEEKD